MRQILQLEVASHRLVGTLHEPPPGTGGAVGVMLVSFGQQPRAWVGDLGAYSGDVLAAAGYPVFRFDMPGTGDSPGNLPVYLEVFWRSIQEGAHAPIAAALLRELQRRYGLRGMVLGGFCGGAVTAAHVAGAADADVLGLVLLEPEMGLTPTSSDEHPRTVDRIDNVSGFVERVELIKQRARSPRSWLRAFAGRSDFSFWFGLIRYAADRARRRRKGQALPPETNHKLLAGWDRYARQKRPVLVLSVASESRRKYYASYGLAPGRSNPAAKLSWFEVPNTTHAMLAGGAKAIVPRHLVAWLQENFPVEPQRPRTA